MPINWLDQKITKRATDLQAARSYHLLNCFNKNCDDEHGYGYDVIDLSYY